MIAQAISRLMGHTLPTVRRFSKPEYLLDGEELTIVIKALTRSTMAIPEMTETLGAQATRLVREAQLAAKIRRAIERSI